MLEYIILALIGGYIVSEIFHRVERKDLMNRIMAKSYDEYKYYDNKYEKDVKEVEDLRDEARKERVGEKETPEKIEEEKVYQEFNKGLEEDWDEDEIDKEKLREQMNKEKLVIKG